MKKCLLVLLTALLLPVCGRGQLWNRLYGDGSRSIFQPSATLTGPTNSGRVAWDYRTGGLLGYNITNNSTDAFHALLRLNAAGDTLWSKGNIFSSYYSKQALLGLCRLGNGDFMVAASCDSSGNRVSDYRLARLDSNGNILSDRLLLKTEYDYYADGGFRVLAEPHGGYIVLASKVVSVNGIISNSAYMDSTVGTLYLQRYNASDMLVRSDSIMSGGISRYVVPGFPGYYGIAGTLTITDALADKAGGLYAIINWDTSYAFDTSIRAPRHVTSMRPGGGYVCRYDSSLHVQWTTDIQTALRLPRGLVTMPYSSFTTSDSGIVVMGYVTDTLPSPSYDYGTFALRLDKAGRVLDTLRLPQTFFARGTETSNGQYLFWMYFQNGYDYIPGLCRTDNHLGFLSFTPTPLGDQVGETVMAPNQYGGAFVPFCYDPLNWYYHTWQPRAASANFDSTLNYYHALVSGRLSYDANRNCAFDAGTDRRLRNQTVILTNTLSSSSYVAFTGAGGAYMLSAPAGNYLVSHSTNINKTLECPGTSFSIPAPGIFPNNDIYDTLIPGRRDMKILMHSARMVPGFTRQLTLYAINTGSVLVNNDTLTLRLPSILTYVAASPSPLTVSGNVMTWVLNGIAPDSTVEIAVSLATPATVAIGTNIRFTAGDNYPSDINPLDNTDTLDTRTAGPYDPNNKAVNRPLYTTARKDWVYTIAFQNCGNYPAKDVVIADRLHPLLDLSTFRLLGASHGMPKMVWQENGQLLFRFEDIYLQDSVHNEPASHGYITYAIQPRGGARVGDKITNTAAIFFDYNALVQTDTTTNILTEERLGVSAPPASGQFAAYPNPTTGALSIQSSAPGEATVLDMQGRSLLRCQITAGKTSIRLPENLAPGIYILQGRTSGGERIGVLRIVVQ